MADFLLQAILSNLLVSTVLAAIAWFVQSRYQAASLANLLWILVLIKMVTPPLFSIPLLQVDSVASINRANTSNFRLAENRPTGELRSEAVGELNSDRAIPALQEAASTQTSQIIAYSLQILGLIWVIVSAVLFAVSILRIIRFHFLLRNNIHPAKPQLTTVVRQLASQMKLRRPPHIVLSQANISPFVWWMGGRPQIVIPESALNALDKDELRMIIAHEMAHIKRRDHWVRWLEWMTVLCLWWNPVMWWARRQLRMTEEIACDATVIQSLSSKRHKYASSLLNMAELLTTSAIRPPAVASAINSGGIMEKRLKMIIAEKDQLIPTWLRAAVAGIAICIFPLGLVYAQDYEAVERRLGGAVEAGELSLEQAKTMMDALKRSSAETRYREKAIDAGKRRYLESAKKIEAAVNQEKMSREIAEKRLAELRKAMSAREIERRVQVEREREMLERKKRFAEVVRDVEAAVDAGKLSREEAKEKLRAIEKEMHNRERDDRGWKDREKEPERVDRRKYLETFARDIEAAVDAGKLSKEQAREKLHAIEKEMSAKEREDRNWQEREREQVRADHKRRFAAVVREIEAAVDEGKLSREEAKAKLRAIEQEVHNREREDRGRKDREREREVSDSKKRYAAIARELEAAVDEGKLSKEEAREKMRAIEQEIVARERERRDRASDEEKNREIRARRARYEEIANEIRAAVEAEKLSNEDAEKKLIELRKKMFEERR